MRKLDLRIDARAIQTIWCVLFFAVSVNAATLTVKSGGGGNFTSIQACATAMAPGDTCTVYSGAYNEKVTVPAGTAGNYKIITVNGSDVVTVQSFTLNSHTKLIGNCSIVPSAINTCGFNIQNPTSPSSAACVALPNGATDIYIRNNVMYACGSADMITSSANSYIYIQGNTLSYACTTQASAGTVKECNGIETRGNHFLVENNDVSHVTYNDFSDASYEIIRNNAIHDLYETEAGGNAHTDAFYFSTATGSNYVVIEGNYQYHDVGPNAKGLLTQAQYSPCFGCSYGMIYRHNTINGIGSGNTSTYEWHYLKVYNNTYVNLGQSCGGCYGGIDNYFQGSLYTADVNNIYYFGFAVPSSGAANPIAVDNADGGATADSGNWGYDLAYCNATGASNCALFGHIYEQGTWTGEPGNILGYQDHVPSNNPNFVNLAGNDFHLQAGSPAIGAGTYLTTVAASDSGSGTSLVVNDAYYFQDSYGLSNAYSTVQPDCISVGTAANQVCVTAVNYSTSTLTLSRSISRSAGQRVYLYSKSDGAQVLTGSAPDMGAYPYAGGNSGSVVPPTILSAVVQ